MGFFGTVRESLFGESSSQQAQRVLSEAHDIQQGAMAHVREGMSAMMTLSLALEDKGWIEVDGLKRDDGQHLTFAAIQSAAKHGTALVQGNPIIHTAALAQYGYVHGEGCRIDGADQIVKKNRHSVFGTQAMLELEITKAATGNVLLLVNDDDTIQVIPFYQIQGAVYDPSDSSKIQYFLRKWDEQYTDFETSVPTTVPRKMLYRNMSYDLPREADLEQYIVNADALEEGEDPIIGVRAREIAGVEVYLDGVVRHVAPNRMVGGAWGIPDILSGIFYSGQHKELMEAGDAVWRAQSQYAVQFQAKTQKQLAEVAAKVAMPQYDSATGDEVKYGQTTGMGSDVSMQLTQKIGAGIDFRQFDPIANLASVGLGVPLSVILGQEEPGTGIPFVTKQRMNAIRRLWTEVFEDIFDHMGKRKAKIHWPKMDPDPTHRQVQSIAGLAKLKLASPEEVRGLFIKTFGTDWEEKVPDASLWDEFSGAQQTNAPGSTEATITPGQGQTGQLGKLADGDHELRDEGLQDHYTPKG